MVVHSYTLSLCCVNLWVCVISDTGSQPRDKCCRVKWIAPSPCLAPPSFVTLITPGIIITSHSPAWLPSANLPWKKFRRIFPAQESKDHLVIWKANEKESSFSYLSDTTLRTGTTRWTCGLWSATLTTSTSPWWSPLTRSGHNTSTHVHSFNDLIKTWKCFHTCFIDNDWMSKLKARTTKTIKSLQY